MRATKQKVQELVQNAPAGRIFTVDFIKRSTGELRTMNCRKGVSKGVTGKGMSYKPNTMSLVPVWDMQANGFRMISLEGVKRVAMEGKVYKVR